MNLKGVNWTWNIYRLRILGGLDLASDLQNIWVVWPAHLGVILFLLIIVVYVLCIRPKARLAGVLERSVSPEWLLGSQIRLSISRLAKDRRSLLEAWPLCVVYLDLLMLANYALILECILVLLTQLILLWLLLLFIRGNVGKYIILIKVPNRFTCCEAKAHLVKRCYILEGIVS